MTYCFEIIKSEKVSDKLFESAFYCSITSIESVLSGHEVSVEYSIPSILIKQKKQVLSLMECKKLLSGCFSDASGNAYQEFTKVLASEQSNT